VVLAVRDKSGEADVDATGVELLVDEADFVALDVDDAVAVAAADDDCDVAALTEGDELALLLAAAEPVAVALTDPNDADAGAVLLAEGRAVTEPSAEPVWLRETGPERLGRAVFDALALADELVDRERVGGGELLDDGEPEADALALTDGVALPLTRALRESRGDSVSDCNGDTVGERDCDGCVERVGRGDALVDADADALFDDDTYALALTLALGSPEADAEPLADAVAASFVGDAESEAAELADLDDETELVEQPERLVAALGVACDCVALTLTVPSTEAERDVKSDAVASALVLADPVALAVMQIDDDSDPLIDPLAVDVPGAVAESLSVAVALRVTAADDVALAEAHAVMVGVAVSWPPVGVADSLALSLAELVAVPPLVVRVGSGVEVDDAEGVSDPVADGVDVVAADDVALTSAVRVRAAD